LYSIFAICSAKEEGEIESLSEEKKSSEYLAMGKSLGLQVCDEADTDAVRALSLMVRGLFQSSYVALTQTA
jgi:hypothetical protein